MGLYKPQSQFMSPNGTTIDNRVENDFITRITGDYCSGYIWTIPTIGTATIPNVTLNTLVKLTTPLYNEDNLILSLPAGSFSTTTLSRYLNRQLFWNVTLIGRERTITTNVTSGQESVLTIPNGNFKSGDYVYLDHQVTGYPNEYYIGVTSDLTYKLYDTREKAMAMLTTTEYKAQLFTAGVLNNKKIYPCAKSDNIAFRTINVGSLTIEPTTIDRFYYTFIPTYIQENNIAINNFQATLYDSNKQILEQTEIIYSSNIRMEVEALLSGNTYYIQFTAINNVGFAYDTGLVEMTVQYEQPKIQAPLLAENICEDSTIALDWKYLISVPGTIIDCYDYVENFMWEGNTGLYLCPNAILTYDLYEIPIIINEQPDGSMEGSLPTLVWRPESKEWTGDIMKVSNSVTGEYVIIGYDGEAIYLDVNGVRVKTQLFEIEESTRVVGKNCVYLIGLTRQNTAVHKFFQDEIDASTKIIGFDVLGVKSDRATLVTSVESFVGIRKYEYYANGKKVGETNENKSTDIFELTGLQKLTEYTVYVVVTDRIGNQVTSEELTFTTLSTKPRIKSISATTLGKTYATLVVNTIADNQIIHYSINYNDLSIGHESNTFNLTGLEADTVVDTKFQVIDSLMQFSDIFDYSFKTIEKELSIISLEVSDIQEYTALATLKYNAVAGLDRFVWILDGVEVETTTNSIHTLHDLIPNKDYILNVKMYDLDGNWVISADVPFKTQPLAPIINNVSVYDITNHSATFDVDVDAQSGVDTYEVIDKKE